MRPYFLSGLEVSLVLNRIRDGVPYKEISKEFGVSSTYISTIAVKYGIRKRRTNRRVKGQIK